ncbi:MAG: glycosyltransferase [Planctomycetota bacterium]
MSTSPPPTTAVFVAAYNQAESLTLVLAALAAAPRTDFEVHVADDGSAPRMEERLHGEVEALPFPMTFHWQEDRGFRKAEILNAAVLTTKAELLIFLDGDCIPSRNLVRSTVGPIVRASSAWGRWASSTSASAGRWIVRRWSGEITRVRSIGSSGGRSAGPTGRTCSTAGGRECAPASGGGTSP